MHRPVDNLSSQNFFICHCSKKFIIYYKLMNQPNIQDFLTKNVSTLYGVGARTKKILKKKKIEKISDLLWNLPQGYTDRSNLQTLDKLEIGKITTIKVKVIKYNFPRIRNLPNRVFCEDSKGKIDIIFFTKSSLLLGTT